MQNKNHCLTDSEIETHLKQAGIRVTAQRIAICRYVLCEADHPTADKIKSWVDQNFPKMSLATVYNTLNLLVESGLLKELKFAHSDSAVYDNNLAKHHHFLDEKTGILYDIPATQVNITAHLDEQYQVKGMDILLKGSINS